MLQGASAFDTRGLGLGPGDPVDAPSGSSGGGSGWDKALDIFGKGADIFSKIKDSTRVPAGPGMPPGPPPNNTLKYVAIGGGALLITGLAIWGISKATKKKK